MTSASAASRSPHAARRARRFLARLVRERRLSADDLILPVSFARGPDRRACCVDAGVQRRTLDELLPVAEQALTSEFPPLALFPVVEGTLKTAGAEEAFNPEGLVPASCAR
jgi:porphobilinogen synthase